MPPTLVLSASMHCREGLLQNVQYVVLAVLQAPTIAIENGLEVP